MKLFIATVASVIGFQAHAATVYVNDNVFTASNPGSSVYNSNLNQLSAEFSKVSSLQMGQLKFAGAAVDSEKQTIRYKFQQIDASGDREVCWSSLAFTVSLETSKVSQIQAQKNCTKDQD